MTLQRPQAWARWLLECALPRDVRDDVSGDLEEIYHARAAARGVRPARFWYAAQTIVFTLRFLAERLRDRALSLEVVSAERPVVRAAGKRENDALFAHLFASQQVRERRVFWIAGVLLNVPVALLIFQNTLAEHETGLVDLGSTVVADDHSVLLAAPAAQPEPAPTADDGALDHASAHRAVSAGETASRPVRAVSEPAGLLQAPVESSLPGVYANGVESLPDRLRARVSSSVLLPGRIHRVSATAASDARASLGQRLAQFNDSLTAARAAAEAADEWTIANRAGERSGISRGTVHGGGSELRVVITLGDSTPDVFRPAPGRRSEWASRVQLWHEIQQQARRAEVSAIFNDRVRQIRERKNSARSGSESGGLGSRTVIALSSR